MSKRKRNEDGDDEIGPKRKSLSQNTDNGPDTEIDCSQAPDFMTTATMGVEAEVGIIEQIVVKNFMNHTLQDIKFGPQVNFVIGQNGSGKSAILTALVIGLGGKAINTSRGSSIRGFIKDGKSHAEVIVKLRNRGQDAYRPEVYGKSIIVERKISRDSSSYKIKSATGKLVSVKREELFHLTEHLNIQVENPLVLLNQDTSRNFLHSKSPNDKYKFFLKATQLDQMKEDYVAANESKEIAIETLTQKTETLPALEKEVLEWEQKYKALSSLQDLKNKLDRLKNELVWALISERERSLKPIMKELRTENARTPIFLKKVEDSENEMKVNQAKHDNIEKELTTMSKRLSVLEPDYRKARQSREDMKKKSKVAQGEVQKVHKEMKSLNKDKEEIMARICEIQNSAQQDFQAENRARMEKIAQLEGALQELLARKNTTEHEREQLTAAVQHLKREVNQAKGEQEEIARRKNELRQHLQALESSRINRLSRFGGFMPKLIQKIDEAHARGNFHKKPIGPLGAHFTLKDQRWALAVETCLKSMMYAFCVHDHHDERVLEQLLKATCPNGRIPITITCPFQDRLYDVSRSRPRTTKYPTVLEVLKIDSPVVSNCLVDQRSIETLLLFDDMKESRNVMADNPPPGAREAFNIEGDQIHCNPFRYYSNNESQVKILVQSVEEDILRVRKELANLDVQLKQKQDQTNLQTRELQKNTQEERKTQTQIMRLQENISKTQMELNDLMNIEEPTPVDVKTLEEEVEHLEESLSRLQQTLTIKEGALNVANDDFQQSEQNFQAMDSEIVSIAEQTEPIKHQLAVSENAILAARSHKQHYDMKLKEHQKKISDLQRRYDQYQTELETEVVRAERVCTRVNSKRTSQNLESEIRQIGKQITVEEKVRGNHEEITQKYHERQNSYIMIRTEVNQLTSFLKALQRVMDKRQEQYATFRRMIANRAKLIFMLMLATRKYSGKMVFDHRKESLDLNVTPTQDNEASKDMRSLSGGERSFATVCFILSLWDAMESPFRCLDEFDIFMDMVNRRISMDIMMSVAQSQKGRQFIFLTPQNMSHVTIDPTMVKIFQMNTPDRGQDVLPFKPVREDEDSDEEA